jgi:hypothetical protein
MHVACSVWLCRAIETGCAWCEEGGDGGRFAEDERDVSRGAGVVEEAADGGHEVRDRVDANERLEWGLLVWPGVHGAAARASASPPNLAPGRP